jgi:hypothetical protein
MELENTLMEQQDDGVEVVQKSGNYVVSKGIDTSAIMNNRCFPGIMGKTDPDKRKAAEKDPNNYVTTVEFPIASVGKDGKFLSTYEKDGNEVEGHANITVGIKLNMATYTNLSPAFKEDRKQGVSKFNTPARVHVPEGATKGRIVMGGKTQFDLDLDAIAKESHTDRVAALKAKGMEPQARLKAKDADKRIDITTKEQVAAKDGIGAVTPETLRTAFTQVAATSFLLQNKKDVEDDKVRGAFDKKSIEAAGKLVSDSYNKVMADVVAAVNGNKGLGDLPVAQGKGTIDGTGFQAPKGGFAFKFVEADVKGATAYAIQVTGDAATAKSEISNVLKSAGNRVNKTITQDVNKTAAKAKNSDEYKASSTYQVASSAKFNLAPVNVKDNDGKATSLTVVSPRVSAQLSPYASKVTMLNNAITNPEVGASAKVLGNNIERVEGMATEVLKGTQRDADTYAKDHTAAIKAVEAAVKADGKQASKQASK